MIWGRTSTAGQGREKLNIRPARYDDAAALVDVHLESHREAIPWLPMLHSPPDATAYFAGHVLLHEQVFVAELNQIIVGFIAMDGGDVDHLYVAPTYQHRGIGHQFLAMAKTLHPDGLAADIPTQRACAPVLRIAWVYASEFTDGSRNEEASRTRYTRGCRAHLSSSTLR